MNTLPQTGSGSSNSLGIGLALCSISGVMSALVMVPILPEMFRVFADVPDVTFWLPAMMTVPGLCAALLSPVAGYVGDKIGSKWLIVVCLGFYVMFGAAPLVIQDFSLIFATRIGLGIAQTGVLVISLAMISQQFDGPAREKWLALQAAAATGSSVLLLPMSGALASSALGWRGSYLLFFLAILLALFIALQRSSNAAHAAQHDTTAPQTMPWRWLAGQCAVTCASGIIFFSTQFQLGLALAAVGITDTATIGLLSAIAAAGIIVGTFLFMPAKRILGAGLLSFELGVAGLALVIVWQFQTVMVLVSFAFLAMIACGMMLPTLVTTVAAGLPDGVRGRGLGFWNSSFTLAQFIGSAFIGFVLAQPGRTVLDAFGLLGFAAILLAALLGFRWRPRRALVSA